MKKLAFILLFLSLLNVESFSQYQLGGGATTLDWSVKRIGINPFIQMYKGDNPANNKYIGTNIYIEHGFDYSLKAKVKIGIVNHTYDNAPDDYQGTDYYFGLDLTAPVLQTSKSLKKPSFNINITGGFHSWDGHAGGDFSAIAGYRTRNQLHFFTGVDIDGNTENEGSSSGSGKTIGFYYWIPVGIEYHLMKKMAFVLEADIPICPDCHYIFGAGIHYYFGKKRYK